LNEFKTITLKQREEIVENKPPQLRTNPKDFPNSSEEADNLLVELEYLIIGYLNLAAAKYVNINIVTPLDEDPLNKIRALSFKSRVNFLSLEKKLLFKLFW
jgi:hypothetical protein